MDKTELIKFAKWIYKDKSESDIKALVATYAKECNAEIARGARSFCQYKNCTKQPTCGDYCYLHCNCKK